MPSSGSAADVSPNTISADPLGAVFADVTLSRSGEALQRLLVVHHPRPDLGRRSRHDQRIFAARGHVHFGAQRAHLGHEFDQPADLGVGLGVGEAFEMRPL